MKDDFDGKYRQYHIHFISIRVFLSVWSSGRGERNHSSMPSPMRSIAKDVINI